MTSSRLSSAASTGMEFLYSAESIRLAVVWTDRLPRNPYWSSVDPTIHVSLARRLDRWAIAERLLGKYARLPPSDQDTATVLQTYCGIVPHLESLDRADALSARIAEIFRWTSIENEPQGTGPLRLWFTVESVILATHGGYANPARNMTEPVGHRDWSRRVPVRSLIRDLADKTHEQLLRMCDASERRAVAFSAETFSRYAAWGGTIPSACPASGRAADWYTMCQSWFRSDRADLWRRLDLMLRSTGWNLLLAGRAEPWPGS
jgi:hypothetical protein